MHATIQGKPLDVTKSKEKEEKPVYNTQKPFDSKPYHHRMLIDSLD